MFGEKLKQLRLENNITQKELADFLGVTPKAVSFYELNQREPSMDVIVKIAQKFNVPTDYLLDNPIKTNASIKKIPKDLKKILEEEEVTLNGRMVSEEEKEQMLRVLEALYRDAKEKNKRK